MTIFLYMCKKQQKCGFFQNFQMFPDFAFQECFMQTKMIQGQFIVAEYDTGVILDIGHVWKALDASKISFFWQKYCKSHNFKQNMGIFGIFSRF